MNVLLESSPPQELPASGNEQHHQPAKQGTRWKPYIPGNLPLPENKSILKSYSLNLLDISQICPFSSIPMATILVQTIISSSPGPQ